MAAKPLAGNIAAMSRLTVSRALAAAATTALALFAFGGGGATEIACINCGLQAGPARNQPATTTVIPAAAQCVRVQRRQNGETLVNGCDLCAKVKIEHRRPGAQFPTFQDYTLPNGSKLPLPFPGWRQDADSHGTRLRRRQLAERRRRSLRSVPNRQRVGLGVAQSVHEMSGGRLGAGQRRRRPIDPDHGDRAKILPPDRRGRYEPATNYLGKVLPLDRIVLGWNRVSAIPRSRISGLSYRNRAISRGRRRRSIGFDGGLGLGGLAIALTAATAARSWVPG